MSVHVPKTRHRLHCTVSCVFSLQLIWVIVLDINVQTENFSQSVFAVSDYSKTVCSKTNLKEGLSRRAALCKI